MSNNLYASMSPQPDEPHAPTSPPTTPIVTDVPEQLPPLEAPTIVPIEPPPD
jgi:hypothetical protein